MKFNYKGRGFVVVTLAAMLVVVGTVNYQLSRKSLLETSKEFTAYEQAQNEKNTDTDDKEEVKVVDSKENQVEEKVTEASKQIEKQLTSEKNMKKATYILDMKMTREKQRNSLTQDLNEMINNNVSAEIDSISIPVIKGALHYAEEFLLTAAAQRNRNHVADNVDFSENITFAMEELLFDPQTSGGLLFAVKKEDALPFLKELKNEGLPAAIVGHFTQKKEKNIYIK